MSTVSSGSRLLKTLKEFEAELKRKQTIDELKPMVVRCDRQLRRHGGGR